MSAARGLVRLVAAAARRWQKFWDVDHRAVNFMTNAEYEVFQRQMDEKMTEIEKAAAYKVARRMLVRKLRSIENAAADGVEDATGGPQAQPTESPAVVSVPGWDPMGLQRPPTADRMIDSISLNVVCFFLVFFTVSFAITYVDSMSAKDGEYYDKPRSRREIGSRIVALEKSLAEAQLAASAAPGTDLPVASPPAATTPQSSELSSDSPSSSSPGTSLLPGWADNFFGSALEQLRLEKDELGRSIEELEAWMRGRLGVPPRDTAGAPGDKSTVAEVANAPAANAEASPLPPTPLAPIPAAALAPASAAAAVVEKDREPASAPAASPAASVAPSTPTEAALLSAIARLEARLAELEAATASKNAAAVNATTVSTASPAAVPDAAASAAAPESTSELSAGGISTDSSATGFAGGPHNTQSWGEYWRSWGTWLWPSAPSDRDATSECGQPQPDEVRSDDSSRTSSDGLPAAAPPSGSAVFLEGSRSQPERSLA